MALLREQEDNIHQNRVAALQAEKKKASNKEMLNPRFCHGLLVFGFGSITCIALQTRFQTPIRTIPAKVKPEKIPPNHLSMESQRIDESSIARQRPENFRICTSMQMFGNEIRNATLKNNNGLIVICFVAKWSEKCRRMEDFVNDLAENEKDVVFLTVDIDDMKALAWKWMVAAVPTYMLLKRELIVQELQGLNKKALVDTILKWKSRRVLQPFPGRVIPDVEPGA